ncbi:MAG: hypothetical protein MJ252_23680 [archaeon]|nr:hypothetical protein [archaeon]
MQSTKVKRRRRPSKEKKEEDNEEKLQLKKLLETMGMSLDSKDHPMSYYQKLYETTMRSEHKKTRNHVSFAPEEMMRRKRRRSNSKEEENSGRKKLFSKSKTPKKEEEPKEEKKSSEKKRSIRQRKENKSKEDSEKKSMTIRGRPKLSDSQKKRREAKKEKLKGPKKHYTKKELETLRSKKKPTPKKETKEEKEEIPQKPKEEIFVEKSGTKSFMNVSMHPLESSTILKSSSMLIPNYEIKTIYFIDPKKPTEPKRKEEILTSSQKKKKDFEVEIKEDPENEWKKKGQLLWSKQKDLPKEENIPQKDLPKEENIPKVNVISMAIQDYIKTYQPSSSEKKKEIPSELSPLPASISSIQKGEIKKAEFSEKHPLPEETKRNLSFGLSEIKEEPKDLPLEEEIFKKETIVSKPVEFIHVEKIHAKPREETPKKNLENAFESSEYIGVSSEKKPLENKTLIIKRENYSGSIENRISGRPNPQTGFTINSDSSKKFKVAENDNTPQKGSISGNVGTRYFCLNSQSKVLQPNSIQSEYISIQNPSGIFSSKTNINQQGCMPGNDLTPKEKNNPEDFEEKKEEGSLQKSNLSGSMRWRYSEQP